MKLTKNKLRQIIKESLKAENDEQKLLNLVFNDKGFDTVSTTQAFELAETLNIDLISIILKTFKPIGWEISPFDTNISFEFLLGPSDYGILGGLLYSISIDSTNESNVYKIISDLDALSDILINRKSNNNKFPDELAKDKRFLKFFSNVLIQEYELSKI
tara:strand:- start:213 stop:689 length:477 start_codon:yes stop_codon:yes gene_type:complete